MGFERRRGEADLALPGEYELSFEIEPKGEIVNVMTEEEKCKIVRVCNKDFKVTFGGEKVEDEEWNLILIAILF